MSSLSQCSSAWCQIKTALAASLTCILGITTLERMPTLKIRHVLQRFTIYLNKSLVKQNIKDILNQLRTFNTLSKWNEHIV
jgi:hypothetical protein